MKRKIIWWAILLLIACTASYGQVVPFPNNPLPGGATNPLEYVAGYTQDSVLVVGQYGLKGYSTTNGGISNNDVISCDECQCQGSFVGRYASKCAELHSGITVAFAANGYVIADNAGAEAGENGGPRGQAYRIINGVPVFQWGFDLSVRRKFLGFKGTNVYFNRTVADPPGCVVADLAHQTIASGVVCPNVWDVLPKTDNLGRTWKVVVPNSIQVATSPPVSPSPTPTVSTVTPTMTPTLGVQTPCPSPCFTIVTCTPTPHAFAGLVVR